MEKAYVLIGVKRGKARELRATIKALKWVESAELISGRYDLIATLRCNTLREITKLILEEVHPLEGIKSTETLIVFG